jgi:hypothetical protein
LEGVGSEEGCFVGVVEVVGVVGTGGEMIVFVEVELRRGADFQF